MNTWVLGLPQDKVERYVSVNGEALKERYSVDDVYFALWMHYLNRSVQSRIPLSYDDLEDWDFWAAYDSDMSPRDAADDMLEDLGYDLGSEE